MVTVIFHWITPKGFESPHAKKKILARWGLTCKAFGIKRLICVSEEEMEIRDTEINFTHVATMGHAIQLCEPPFIFVEQGGEDMYKFLHPEKATYIFGSDYQGLTEATLSIPSLTPIHAEVAAGLVLSHRYEQWPSQ